MSTKCTIGHSHEHHLYEECFDQSNIYLQFDRVEGKPPVEIEMIRYAGEDSLRLAIPIALWRTLVAEWLECSWAQDPSRDNQKIVFDTSFMDELVALRKLKNLPGSAELVVAGEDDLDADQSKKHIARDDD